MKLHVQKILPRNLTIFLLEYSGTFHNYLNGHYPTNFFMRPTDALEIITITNTLNKKRSSGFDNISTIILCSTIDEIATPLAHKKLL